MQTEFELTGKQADYIRNSTHRWNVACGAVRSGKSHCQISYCIPARLEERRGLRGLRVILGATRANIERNVLQPLRDIYGDSIASSINSNNYATIFGEKVYCIGADNVRQVAKIRGSEIAYCAIDEATDINPEVFDEVYTDVVEASKFGPVEALLGMIGVVLAVQVLQVVVEKALDADTESVDTHIAQTDEVLQRQRVGVSLKGDFGICGDGVVGINKV